MQIEVVGDAAARAAMAQLEDRLVVTQPFFQDAYQTLLRGEERLFDRGPGWERLSAATIARKGRVRTGYRQRGSDHERFSAIGALLTRANKRKRLQSTGRLRRALTKPYAEGQRIEFRDEELIFGLEGGGVAFYGIFHQIGEGVPKRKFVHATRKTRDELREDFRRHLNLGG